TALTLSTTPKLLPGVTFEPTLGSSTVRRSVNCSTANLEMPIVATSSSTRVHSCVGKYFSVFGSMRRFLGDWGSGSLVEGERHDRGGLELAADVEVDGPAEGRVVLRDQGHGQAAAEGGGERAGGNDADLTPVAQDVRPLSGDALARQRQADACASG